MHICIQTTHTCMLYNREFVYEEFPRIKLVEQDKNVLPLASRYFTP